MLFWTNNEYDHDNWLTSNLELDGGV